MFEPPPKKLRIDVLQTQNWTKMNTLMQTDVRFTGRMSQQVPDERNYEIRTLNFLKKSSKSVLRRYTVNKVSRIFPYFDI